MISDFLRDVKGPSKTELTIYSTNRFCGKGAVFFSQRLGQALATHRIADYGIYFLCYTLEIHC